MLDEMVNSFRVVANFNELEPKVTVFNFQGNEMWEVFLDESAPATLENLAKAYKWCLEN